MKRLSSRLVVHLFGSKFGEVLVHEVAVVFEGQHSNKVLFFVHVDNLAVETHEFAAQSLEITLSPAVV